MMYRAVGMGKYKLCFVLLLPLTVCFGSEVTLVKTIGSEPDLTPVCNNSTEDIITLIVCRIRTERNREECRLLYQYRHDFENNCDSRLRLVMENETVFLHLSSLTPVDSGNYSCECSGPGGTNISHLILTVEASCFTNPANSSSPTQVQSAMVAVAVVVTLTAATLGLVHRRRRSRGRHPEPVSSLPSLEPRDIEPYSTFIRRDSGLYSTIRVDVSNTDS